MKNDIKVSEIFHSIQGEGSTMGKPSIFLRLQACNLMCGGRGTEKDGKLHNGATWRCDTIEVWLKGEKWKVGDLAEYLTDRFSQHLKSGSQLVITGGEPMLQQEAFSDLVMEIREKMPVIQPYFRVEVETNGTIIPEKFYPINQYNVSPKLANSGMEKKDRIKPKALRKLATLGDADRAIFKFVVTEEDDLPEILEDFVLPFGLPRDKCWLMPGCSDRMQFEATAPRVAHFCEKYGFHFSSRLQINLWNQTTGV